MITFLVGLLAIPWLLWLLLLVDFIIVTALVEHEEGIWATVVTVGSIIGLNYLWKLSLLTTIKIHPLYTAGLIASYFAIGIGWSTFKWVLFLRKNTFKYSDFKAKFLSDKKTTELTPALAAEMIDSLSEFNRYKGEEEKVNSGTPQFREHKGTLTRWSTYWPFSMVGFALNDVIRKAWAHIVNSLSGMYQSISNRIYKDVAADVKMAEEFKAQQAAAGADGGSTTTTRRRGN